MPADQLPAPARRADAERNRGKILAAARSAFADPDAEVSMAEVARRAGVGMATLYRNFPGRRELVEALYIEEVDAICEAAGTAGGLAVGDKVLLIPAHVDPAINLYDRLFAWDGSWLTEWEVDGRRRYRLPQDNGPAGPESAGSG